jgi:hypothetical protein
LEVKTTARRPGSWSVSYLGVLADLQKRQLTMSTQPVADPCGRHPLAPGFTVTRTGATDR